MSKIFIQIASYRDPQLIPTLKDMIANAKKPKNLVFAIARQFSETDGFDNLDEFRTDKRFNCIDQFFFIIFKFYIISFLS